MADLLVNPADNVFTRLGILGPTVKDFIQNPAFGIPVVGHTLNIPSLALGTATTLDPAVTPSNSDAYRIAKDKGAMKAWRDRQDINPWIKFGAETATGFVDPLNAPLMGTISAGFKGARGAVTGFEHAGSTVRNAASKLPVSKTFKPSLDTALKDIPEKVPGLKDIEPFNWLFQESKQGKVNHARDLAQTLEAVSRAHNLEPTSVASHLHNLSQDQYARAGGMRGFRIGENDAKKFDRINDLLGNYGPKFSDTKYRSYLDQQASNGMDRDEFFRVINSAVRKAAEKEAYGPRGKPNNRAFETFSKLNRGVKDVLLSGGTAALPSYLDYVRADVMRNGVGSLTPKLDWSTRKIGGRTFSGPSVSFPENGFGRILRNRERVTAENRLINNGNWFSPEAGIDVNTYMGSPPDSQSFLQANKYKTMAGLGAGLGAASGVVEGDDPMTILKKAALGAGSGILTKAGYGLGMDLLRKGETIGREAFYNQGAKNFLENSFNNPISSPETTKFIDSLNRYKFGPAILDQMKQKGYLVDDKQLTDMLWKATRKKPQEEGRFADIIQNWRNVQAQARQSGIDLANEIGYNYSDTNNLTEVAKNIMPFPVWPLRNLAFFTKEFGDKPEWAWPILNYLDVSEDQKNAAGLTSKMAYKMPMVEQPLAELMGGTLFGNPANIISVAGQINEPPPHSPGEEVSPLDKFSDTAGNLGISPSPLIEYPLQALGVMDRGSDFQTISPWSRLVSFSHEANSGEYLDPEGIIKDVGAGIRHSIAPQADSDVSYPEYLIRKKLAEMSIEQTGQPWYKEPAFLDAMADPNSDLYVEAAKRAGNEQANIIAARKLLPIQLQWLPNAEQEIRYAKKRAIDIGQLDQSNSQPTEGTNEEDINPVAFGYKSLSNSQDEMIKRIYDLLPDANKEAYLAKHPELKRKTKTKNKGN